MSIVEKAVGKEREKKRTDKTFGAHLKEIHSHDQLMDDQAPGEIIKLGCLSERGLMTILEDEDLLRAFRFLKRGILAKLFNPADPESDTGKVIMVSSAMPGAGKSFLAFNLAASIAREKLIDVILIDGDTVRHNLSTIMRLDDRKGLFEMLQTRKIGPGILKTDLPGFSFIPSGLECENATEMLASEYMSELLASLSDKNTVVVLDTTPLLVSSEADAMSAHVDHTVIVVEAGETSADEIDSMLQMLKKSGSSVSFILNKMKLTGKSGMPDHYNFPY